MSDDNSHDGTDSSIDRRSLLRNMAAGAVGVGGLVTVGSGTSDAAELAGRIRTRGDLDPIEAARALQKADGFDETATTESCYTETKCWGSTCGGKGEVAHRECCPDIAGCGSCCESWNYTNICC